jgi:hypothetical protein
MSNALAIAAVTESLVQMLASNLVAASKVTHAWVSSVPPDRDTLLAKPGVNVFLYQVSPNSAFRNADLPTRGANGTLNRRPQLALDLHYLLTFYGDETALEPQRLLGAATLALHANPVLNRADVQPAPIAPLSSGHSPTGTADSFLGDQSQLIRFTPVTYTLEELSKLWSFLLKVDYVLSTAYRASVLLIETDDIVAGPSPNPLNYGLTVMPMRRPTITSVVASPNAGAPIAAGSQIAINGVNLAPSAGGAAEILIDGKPVAPTLISPIRITLTLPADLAAGPRTAQIMLPLMLGHPPVLHPGTGDASGVFAFVVAPVIAPGSLPGSYAIQMVSRPGSPPTQAIEVKVVSKVQPGQRVMLLLTQTNPPFSRLVDGGAPSAATNTLDFGAPAVPPGTYLVQVLVDGAPSALVAGAGGVPIAPTIEL